MNVAQEIESIRDFEIQRDIINLAIERRKKRGQKRLWAAANGGFSHVHKGALLHPRIAFGMVAASAPGGFETRQRVQA